MVLPAGDGHRGAGRVIVRVLAPSSALNMEDLPTFGLPTNTTRFTFSTFPILPESPPMPSFAGLLTRQARCRQQPFCERQQSPPLRFRRFKHSRIFPFSSRYATSSCACSSRANRTRTARAVPPSTATRSFPNATTLPPKALRCMTRKPAPGANPISHSETVPVIQVDAVHDNAHARGQSRSVMMAPRSPARRRTVSSKRRACVLSMFHT